MSSFGCDDTRANAAAAGAAGFIAKPFSVGQLREAVSAVLAPGPAASAPS
jgi:DNA-binding NarL/FixJ family response regulator